MASLLGYVEILLAAFCYILLVMWQRYRHSKAGKPPSWPVVGMLPEVLLNVRRAHDFIEEMLRKCGGTLQFHGPHMSAMNFLVTCDPRNVQHILTANFVNYPKGPRFRVLFDALGGGIFNVDSDTWRSQRKMFHNLLVGPHSKFSDLVARTMRQKIMDDLVPDLDRACETGSQIDMQETLQRLTFDNTFALIFGLDTPIYRSLKLPVLRYQKAFAEMEEAGWHRHVLPEFVWKFQRFLQIGGERRIRNARTVFDEFLFHCVAAKRLHFSSTPQNDTVSPDLLTSYLLQAQKDQIQFSDKFLRDTAFNFMVAGISSVNACMTWFFYLVAAHPEIEAKILHEIRQNLPSKHRGEAEISESRSDTVLLFGANELSKMVYLHAAFCETLRLYPPVPFNHKTAAGEDLLPSGQRVKEGTMVLTSFYAMGRSEEIWGKDCLEFRPERWISDSGGIVYVPSYKFSPFSTGPRSCLGKDMAFLQMKIVAAAVIWNYCLVAMEEKAPVPTVSIVLHIEGGLKVRVSKREHSSSCLAN